MRVSEVGLALERLFYALRLGVGAMAWSNGLLRSIKQIEVTVTTV